MKRLRAFETEASAKSKESEYMISRASDRRLLILSCSRKKKASSRLLPALERYDGPAFQVLRKFIVECPAEAGKLDIRILSAKFGLIPADQPIPWYDEPMTAHQAAILNPMVSAELKRLLARRKYRKLLLNVGQAYQAALAGHESLVSDSVEVTQASGSSGRRQTILRDWLRGRPPNQLFSPAGSACLRGTKITLTPDEVIDIACRALAEGKGTPYSYQSWYVPVNGLRVAPKWLVSQLTGLPVGAFHSEEARRVLFQLGVKACRS